ncbi:hypothetical protein RB195_014105 [Necator americanus]|uniref:Serine-threonine/tyrosine-protein kinase catalytic domain-containing protein n=1 Tax=Necator americanus TaxID=51031 RepID=A0ABR1DYM8_NECAM
MPQSSQSTMSAYYVHKGESDRQLVTCKGWREGWHRLARKSGSQIYHQRTSRVSWGYETHAMCSGKGATARIQYLNSANMRSQKLSSPTRTEQRIRLENSEVEIICGKLNKMPDNVPADLASFVNEKMWCRDPAARTNFHEIVSFLEKKTGLKLSRTAFEDLPTLTTTMEGSRVIENIDRRRKNGRSRVRIRDFDCATLNTPKPVYGPMAEIGNI